MRSSSTKIHSLVSLTNNLRKKDQQAKQKSKVSLRCLNFFFAESFQLQTLTVNSTLLIHIDKNRLPPMVENIHKFSKVS